MKFFALFVINSCLVIHVCSHGEASQQVTLSCPASAETNRGPAGVPGKRGSKGEPGSGAPGIRGKYVICLRRFYIIHYK